MFRREMYRCDWCDGIVEIVFKLTWPQRYRRTNHSEPVTIVTTIRFTPERSSLPVQSSGIVGACYCVPYYMYTMCYLTYITKCPSLSAMHQCIEREFDICNIIRDERDSSIPVAAGRGVSVPWSRRGARGMERSKFIQTGWGLHLTMFSAGVRS